MKKLLSAAIIFCAGVAEFNSAFAQTWNLVNTGFTSKQVNHIASSADGNMLAAIISGGIYSSTNSGKTWVADNIQSSPSPGIASSADGKKLAVPVYGARNFTPKHARV